MVKPILENPISCIFPDKEECMISSDAAQRLNNQLSLFFPRLLSYVFEFRVEDHKNQVDFAMAISKKEDLIFIKAQYLKQLNHHKVTNWLESCIELLKNNRFVNCYWIEADLNGKENELIPSLFISPTPHHSDPLNFVQFHRVLNFDTANINSEKTLTNCLNLLEQGQYIEHMGIMHSRIHKTTTRLYLKGFTVKTLIPFLDKINWPGNKNLILEQFIDLPEIDYFTIAIEYTTRWLPSIGIEFHFKSDFSSIQQYINNLKNRGFCSTKKAQSIEYILQPQKIKMGKFSFKRSLSHFKINISESDQVEPKVYVQITPSYTSLFGF